MTQTTRDKLIIVAICLGPPALCALLVLAAWAFGWH